MDAKQAWRVIFDGSIEKDPSSPGITNADLVSIAAELDVLRTAYIEYYTEKIREAFA